MIDDSDFCTKSTDMGKKLLAFESDYYSLDNLLKMLKSGLLFVSSKPLPKYLAHARLG